MAKSNTTIRKVLNMFAEYEAWFAADLFSIGLPPLDIRIANRHGTTQERKLRMDEPTRNIPHQRWFSF